MPIITLDQANRVVEAAMRDALADADGAVPGAVSVTRDTSDNDEICALAGIEAAGLGAQS